jgi:hypothetical protein
MMLYHWVSVFRYFKAHSAFIFRAGIALKMKAVCSCEMSGNANPVIQHYIWSSSKTTVEASDLSFPHL